MTERRWMHRAWNDVTIVARQRVKEQRKIFRIESSTSVTPVDALTVEIQELLVTRFFLHKVVSLISTCNQNWKSFEPSTSCYPYVILLQLTWRNIYFQRGETRDFTWLLLYLELFLLRETPWALSSWLLSNETHDSNYWLMLGQHCCYLINAVPILREDHNTGGHILGACAVFVNKLCKMFQNNLFEFDQLGVTFKGWTRFWDIHEGTPSRRKLREQKTVISNHTAIHRRLNFGLQFIYELWELTVPGDFGFGSWHSFGSIHDAFDKVVKWQDAMLQQELVGMIQAYTHSKVTFDTTLLVSLLKKKTNKKNHIYGYFMRVTANGNTDCFQVTWKPLIILI